MRTRTLVLEALRIAQVHGRLLRTRIRDDHMGRVWIITIEIDEPEATSIRDAKRRARELRG